MTISQKTQTVFPQDRRGRQLADKYAESMRKQGCEVNIKQTTTSIAVNTFILIEEEIKGEET